MPYLIDSDWLIDYLAGGTESLQLLESVADEGIAISILTYMEVYQGILRSPRPEEVEAQLRGFLGSVPIIPISLEVAQRCARAREILRVQGKRVNQRAIDLLIAATALEHGLILVTRNNRDYADIPGLVILP
ncbi:MAG: type II toxin-antitoxin system VapC family toxin [SAR202 cluster bacterium]|nr:type II toxin-antitoxin system VapC family toxin [SAR202 cluster bacterium]